MRVKCDKCTAFVPFRGLESYCSNCGAAYTNSVLPGMNNPRAKAAGYKKLARIYGTITVIGLILSFLVPAIIAETLNKNTDTITGLSALLLVAWLSIMSLIFEINYRKKFPDMRRN